MFGSRNEQERPPNEDGGGRGRKSDPRQLWFFKHPDPVIRVTGYVSLFTGALAVIAAFQLLTLVETNSISTATQRAFLYVDTLSMKRMPDPRDEGRVFIRWYNSGATAARDFRFYRACWASETIRYTSARAEEIKRQVFAKRTKTPWVRYVPPSAPGDGGSCAIPLKDMTAILRGERYLTVFAKADYRDLSGVLRTTEFCTTYVTIRVAPETGELSGITSLCPDYNCSDEQCEKQK